MPIIRRSFLIVPFALLLLAIVLRPLIDQPSTAAAQTTDPPTEAWITLPQAWNGPASISQAEIDATMPPFALLEHQGEFTLTRIDAGDGPHFRVQRAAEEQASDQLGQLRFAWTITDEQLVELADQVLTVTFEARGYAPPTGARVFIEEENGAASSSTSMYVNNVQWEDFVLSRAILPEATAVRIGLDWGQAPGAGWLEFSELHVQRSAATEYTDVMAPTDAPTAPPTPTPTPASVVVTSTPTAANLFAAATLAAQATADAQTTGTATSTPESMVTATFTPTPTATPIPIVVTNTPTPSNMETATIVALEAEARLFTTGTPTPYPEGVAVLMATSTNTPASQGQPTPLFVLLEDIPPTRAPTATPIFPAELVGKIVFKANLFGTNRRPDYMIMNPDGTGVGRLTGAYHYSRAAERDHYSGDRRFYASVSKEQDGFHRIQIFYDFIEYGTQRQLTYFGAGTAWDPAWSPVDERVVMVSNESKNDEIWIVERGDWPAIKLTNNDWEWDNHPSFSPDGNQIVFMSNRNSGRRQLWIMGADGDKQRQLTNFLFEAWDPVWVKYAD